MSTDIAICNAALLMVNASTINSFDDSTREATLCEALYGTTRDAVLSKHPWSFSIFQEALAQTVTTPLMDYTYEYQLPTGYIRILKTDGRENDYRVLKNKLLTNSTAVDLLYQKDPGEEFWPAYFRRIVEFKLASLLSLALVQDENMAQLFDAQYRTAMQEGRGTDSQNSPTHSIPERELSLTAIRGSDG